MTHGASYGEFYSTQDNVRAAQRELERESRERGEQAVRQREEWRKLPPAATRVTLADGKTRLVRAKSFYMDGDGTLTFRDGDDSPVVTFAAGQWKSHVRE